MQLWQYVSPLLRPRRAFGSAATLAMMLTRHAEATAVGGAAQNALGVMRLSFPPWGQIRRCPFRRSRARTRGNLWCRAVGPEEVSRDERIMWKARLRDF